jgi:hypothetical protein
MPFNFTTGNELKAFFDKEEKMYQSTASVKSDEDKSTLPSGITIRWLLVLTFHLRDF